MPTKADVPESASPVDISPATDMAYGVIVSSATLQADGWNMVVSALVKKYPSAKVIVVPELSEEQLTEALRKVKARRAAVVAQPQEVNRVLFLNIHRASRRVDDDVWGDCICGVITGASAEAARRVAEESTAPLVMKRLLATTNVDHRRFEHSYCITDWTGAPVREQSGYTEPTQTLYSQDTEEGKKMLETGLQSLFARQLETQKPQLIITSSHATQFNLEMPFGYGLIFPANGYFYPASPADMKNFGQVLGMAYRRNHTVAEQWVRDNEMKRIEPDGTTRVWLAAGNCLFGDAYSSPDSMAITALSTYGCRQVVGYTVPSWYGEGGWGTMGSLFSNAEGTSLAEAWFLNNQFLLNRTCELEPRLLNVRFDSHEFFGPSQQKMVYDMVKAGIQLRQENLKDYFGLIHDRDVVALYGDPAWRAVVDESNVKPAFRVTWNGADSFTVSSETGGKGRVGIFFPDAVSADAVIGCDAQDAVFTNDFILFRELELAPGASREVKLQYRGE